METRTWQTAGMGPTADRQVPSTFWSQADIPGRSPQPLFDAPNLKMASIAAAVSPIAAQLALARTEKSTVRPRTRESACSDDAPIDGRIGVQF